ncbi:MAG: sulfite exporter TauE/SafE family protein [candidate division KSB1 bacterium]|nr:sulfite exporter TauE/SafE family protein [candidate division KSB1 bacterium]MDZ7301027.1 sulfite exporter TauE/SafE family protein [candidate division KSB1 bacterium]MDZ7310295.1 sulfite exporter TauE/SafE family protein [candidate division KSB1 bacterium]
MAHLVNALVGFLAGMLGGGFGVGGGIIIVPALTIFFSVPYHTAVGTSLAIIIPIALAAALRHFSFGRVDLNIAWAMAIGGIVGSVFGATLIQKVPAMYARRAFALLLIYMAYRMWSGK